MTLEPLCVPSRKAKSEKSVISILRILYYQINLILQKLYKIRYIRKLNTIHVYSCRWEFVEHMRNTSNLKYIVDYCVYLRVIANGKKKRHQMNIQNKLRDRKAQR